MRYSVEVDKDWEARFRATEVKLSFQQLFVASVVVAVANAGLGVFEGPLQYDRRSWFLSILFVAFWLILFVVALVKFKKRGLWLLFGAPFALFFPFLVLMLAWACGHNQAACP